MFDRCFYWRRQLSRRADGSLPVSKWGALDAHLARCPRCYAAQEADDTLRSVLSRHTGYPDAEIAEAFDERVLRDLRSYPTLALSFRERLMARLRGESPAGAPRIGFLMQITGGALAAACVTAWCLLPTLRPPDPSSVVGKGDITIDNTARNEPPVPLESLLVNPAPRAALLWTTPSAPKPHRSPLPAERTAPPPAKSGAPRDTRSHAAADSPSNLG